MSSTMSAFCPKNHKRNIRHTRSTWVTRRSRPSRWGLVQLGAPKCRWQDAGLPGTNLTRDEAAARASILDVTSYSVDLDLTTGDTTFASTTTIRFTCREPGAATFADLVDATIHEITLNGESLDP